MALTSIGDMARHFMSLHHGTAIRQRMAVLERELSTGTAADPVAHLDGRADRLADLDRRIALGTAQAGAARAIGQRLETAQVALGQVDDLRAARSTDLVGFPVSAGEGDIAGAAGRAEAAFAAAVSALNSRHGGESLFAGAASDRPALGPADDILSALRAVTAGATDAADLAARVDAFLDDPGGGFATTAYLGDTGAPAVRRIDGERGVTLGPRADDPAIREVLRGLALAAVAADDGLPLTATERGDLLRSAGTALVDAAAPFAAARARLGAAQEDAETAATRHSAALTAASLQRNDLIGADPADTVSALTQIRTQLETQYAATARLAGLTLAGFLR